MVGISDSASVPNLKRVVTETLECQFKSNKEIHVQSWDSPFPCLERSEADLLEVPLLEEEIHGELMRVGGNETLSPNEFTFKFAQTFWADLKGELLSLLDYIFELAKFDHRFSSSFISLIPTVNSPLRDLNV